MSKVLFPNRVAYWFRELGELWVGRRSENLFVAVSSEKGVRYVPLPTRIWPTKSHEFWVFLGALLHRLQPESLLEMGSGRSSLYLSEYAEKKEKPLVSIDQDLKWVMLARLVARVGHVRKENYFHHVPLDATGYYDQREIERLIVQPPDFIYLDGPNGDRSGFMQQDYMLGLCAQADVIIMDDIQRHTVYDQMEALHNRGMQRKRTVIGYKVYDRMNYLCVLARDDLQSVVDELLRALRIEPVTGYSREQCTRH